jgi:hypothetical protein
MSRTWFTASVLVSILRKAVSSVVMFLGPSWDGPRRAYRPQQLLDRTSASSR